MRSVTIRFLFGLFLLISFSVFSAKQSVSNNITLPKLINLSFSSNNIDVTNSQQWIDVTIVYEAEFEPVAAFIYLSPPEGIPSSHKKSVSFYLESWELNEETNTYSSTTRLNFDDTDAAGDWSASIPLVTGQLEKVVSAAVDTSELIALGVNPIIHITNPNAVDVTAPELRAIEFSSTEVDVTNGNQLITLTATFYDEGSAMDYLSAQLNSAVSSQFKLVRFDTAKSEWKVGPDNNIYTISTTITFDQDDPSGEWHLRIKSASDTNGNLSEYHTAEKLNDLGFVNTKVNVTNSNTVDITAPKLVSLELSPQQIDISDTSQTIDVTLTMFDAGSTIANVGVAFIAPSGPLSSDSKFKLVNDVHWKKGKEANTYVRTFQVTFGTAVERGLWKVEIASTLDFNWNYGQGLSYKDIIKLGSNPILAVSVDEENITDLAISVPPATEAEVGESIKTVFNLSRNLASESTSTIELEFSLSEQLTFNSLNYPSDFVNSADCTTLGSQNTCVLHMQSGWGNLDLTLDLDVIGTNAHTIQMDIISDALELNYENNKAIQHIKTANFPATLGDYDGDGRADLGLTADYSGLTFVKDMHTGLVNKYVFGRKGDIPVAGDFDGDGVGDIAVWRPLVNQGFALKSSDGQVLNIGFENHSAGLPVPADYNGDGITDFAQWSPHTGVWTIKYDNSGYLYQKRFGLQFTDIPVPADYDGDGIDDIAIRRSANSTWYILQSSNGLIKKVRFGLQATDIPVPADYDGDGLADIAVRRPSTSTWYILQSSNNKIRKVRFGLEEDDIPVVSDYDDDGKADIAIRRTSNYVWYILRSSDNKIQTNTFGTHSTLVPILAPILLRTTDLAPILLRTPMSGNKDEDIDIKNSKTSRHYPKLDSEYEKQQLLLEKNHYTDSQSDTSGEFKGKETVEALVEF